MCCVIVFASSLLSLISPWAGSRGARRRGAPVGGPLPRPPQVPPPPSRRHSVPPASTPPPPPLASVTKHRRYSDIRNSPVSKLDLRQELINLNLSTQEFNSWLGGKFEENDEYENEPYDERFEHDIPLQRSISLDRGIDIFNHLKSLGSVSTGSVGSAWTVDSDGLDLAIERYRSFEDIPTSPYKVRSRRASYGVQTFSERDVALAVLNESYKGLDVGSGSVSPQIKKLQRCFTFSETFDSIYRNSVENLDVQKERPKFRVVITNRIDVTSCPVSPEIRRLKNFSFRNSADDLGTKFDDEDQKAQEPVYRSISVEWNKGELVRQRRSGLAIKKNLRKEVLVKQEFKSCENLFGRLRGSPELAESTSKSTCLLKTADRNAKIKKNISFSANTDSRLVVPTIVISHADHKSGVAKSNTSNYVGIGRNCDCRICNEGDRGCFIRNVLSKLFVKIVSFTYSKKCYWDENNNVNDSEMYKCLMNVLKLMLGLWLRHLDHKVE